MLKYKWLGIELNAIAGVYHKIYNIHSQDNNSWLKVTAKKHTGGMICSWLLHCNSEKSKCLVNVMFFNLYPSQEPFLVGLKNEKEIELNDSSQHMSDLY